MFAVGATVVYASSSFNEAVALITCAGSLVSLASMGVNLAILSLVLSAKRDIEALRKEFKEKVTEQPQTTPVINFVFKENPPAEENSEECDSESEEDSSESDSCESGEENSDCKEDTEEAKEN